ncbi:hypothetical protein N9E66_05085 [Gammaproteobacteria bacterium]|nr:hypothetical protein [Gammaproteobacteria bacterium]
MKYESITIFGSGADDCVNIYNDNDIFINSSCGRLANTGKAINLVITDGLLSLDNQLKNLKPAAGLSKNDSFEMRRNKRLIIQRCNIKNIYVSTELSQKIIKDRLIFFNIKYKKLKIINKKNIYLQTIKILFFQRGFVDMKFFFLAMRALLLGIIFNKTVSGLYKPSTGIIAALIFYKIYNIKLNGIGNQNKSAFYGKEEGLEEYKFNNIHEKIDKLILTYFHDNGHTNIP